MTTPASAPTSASAPTGPALPLPDGLTPDSVDTLTELTTLLTKLRAAQAAAAAAATAPDASVTGTTPLPSGGNTTAAALLQVKELPAATDSLKHKLQRARAAARQLPDVGRTIAQQEAEIAALEARRRTQLRELARIRGEGLQFSAGEQSRGDYEGERMVE